MKVIISLSKPSLVGVMVAVLLSGCAGSTTLQVSNSPAAAPTQKLGSQSCEIQYSSLLFAKNIKSYSGFDLAFVLPNGCAPTWTGMTEVRLDVTVKFERVGGGKLKWIDSNVGFVNLGFVTSTDCQGPEWGCPPAPGRLSDAAANAQLYSLYEDCLSNVFNPCEVQIRFSAMDYLERSQPLFPWVAINRINVPGPNKSYEKWDRSQNGGTLTVSGTLSFDQVQP